jgi:hypothetical protein
MEAASEWKRIITMLERYSIFQYLEWTKEEFAKIEELLNK